MPFSERIPNPEMRNRQNTSICNWYAGEDDKDLHGFTVIFARLNAIRAMGVQVLL
jgi:hypothetical protein